MEDLKTATNAELEDKASELESKFNENKYLISSIWEEMGALANEYDAIKEELDRRNGRQHE